MSTSLNAAWALVQVACGLVALTAAGGLALEALGIPHPFRNAARVVIILAIAAIGGLYIYSGVTNLAEAS